MCVHLSASAGKQNKTRFLHTPMKKFHMGKQSNSEVVPSGSLTLTLRTAERRRPGSWEKTTGFTTLTCARFLSCVTPTPTSYSNGSSREVAAVTQQSTAYAKSGPQQRHCTCHTEAWLSLF